MTHSTLDPLAGTIDPDYVRCFEQMAYVEVAIRRRGPSPHLLLRRAMLLMAMGNYAPALEAAQAAVQRSPRNAEAHFQEGLAWLALARVQCGAIVAPGAQLPQPRPLLHLVEQAYGAFCASAQCSGEAEAASAAEHVESLLNLDPRSLQLALQAA